MRVFNLAKQYCGARFLVWENVPGALSSNKGEDFGTILETMVGCKFNPNRPVWGNEGACFGQNSMLEWAVLDSQWFGVAQRRRRLFIVLDTGNWHNRQPILLQPETMRTMAKSCKSSQYDSSTINTKQPYTYALVGNTIGRKPSAGGNGGGFSPELMYTLTATDHHAIVYNNCIRKITPIEAERLQGFPDNYTYLDNIPISKRMNALGRTMTIPVIKWIGQQIQKNMT